MQIQKQTVIFLQVLLIQKQSTINLVSVMRYNTRVRRHGTGLRTRIYTRLRDSVIQRGNAHEDRGKTHCSMKEADCGVSYVQVE